VVLESFESGSQKPSPLFNRILVRRFSCLPAFITNLIRKSGTHLRGKNLRIRAFLFPAFLL